MEFSWSFQGLSKAKVQTAAKTTCPCFRRFAGISNAELSTDFGVLRVEKCQTHANADADI